MSDVLRQSTSRIEIHPEVHRQGETFNVHWIDQFWPCELSHSIVESVEEEEQCISLFQSLLAALNGMCTYVIPTVIFFFLRTSPTPDLAQNYLSNRNRHSSKR